MANRYEGRVEMVFPADRSRDGKHGKHDELVAAVSAMFNSCECGGLDVENDGRVAYLFWVQGMSPPLSAGDFPVDFAARFGTCVVRDVVAFTPEDTGDFVIGEDEDHGE
jgi:hypothetical protein